MSQQLDAANVILIRQVFTHFRIPNHILDHGNNFGSVLNSTPDDRPVQKPESIKAQLLTVKRELIGSITLGNLFVIYIRVSPREDFMERSAMVDRARVSQASFRTHW